MGDECTVQDYLEETFRAIQYSIGYIMIKGDGSPEMQKALDGLIVARDTYLPAIEDRLQPKCVCEEKCEEECKNHAIANDNHADVELSISPDIEISVNIGGKDFTMDEAEAIYYRLKELFEVMVVGSPYPVYPVNPSDWWPPTYPTYPWITYEGGTSDNPFVVWGINICETEE